MSESTTMPDEYRRAVKAFLNDFYVLWAGNWLAPEWRGDEAVLKWWGRAVEAANEISMKAHTSLPEPDATMVDSMIFALMECAEERSAREAGRPTRAIGQVERLVERMGYVKKDKEK